MVMADRIKTNLDDDIHEEVLRRHRETGRAKSKIVNDMCRTAVDEEESSGRAAVATFLGTVGQSLFVLGPIIVLLQPVMAVGGFSMMLAGILLVTVEAMQHVDGGTSVREALPKMVGGA